jgi:hypothetical protein
MPKLSDHSTDPNRDHSRNLHHASMQTLHKGENILVNERHVTLRNHCWRLSKSSPLPSVVFIARIAPSAGGCEDLALTSTKSHSAEDAFPFLPNIGRGYSR